MPLTREIEKGQRLVSGQSYGEVYKVTKMDISSDSFQPPEGKQSLLPLSYGYPQNFPSYN